MTELVSQYPDPEGNYVLFSGNEVGAMLLKYICQERTALGTMPKDPVAVKTIVTTDICKKIAAEYNVELEKFSQASSLSASRSVSLRKRDRTTDISRI